MNVPKFDILIVGGGHGGAQTAISLRQGGFEGSTAIISDESEIPYERPPLSKEYFSGEKSADRIRIRPAEFWPERGIELLLGNKVISVDPEQHIVTTSTGRTIEYGKLVWAAGGTARRLPLLGSDAANVLTVRNLDDADLLKALAGNARNIVIVGGGYIGLEAAAVLNKAGKQVVLVEALDHVLARVAGVSIAKYVEAVHRGHGVDLRLSSNLVALEGSPLVTGAKLSCGEIIPCDLMVMGIGMHPNVDVLSAAGAQIENGVIVDEYCRTSLKDIFAIGDCAAHSNRFAGSKMIRLESVQNASDMARAVANVLLDKPIKYEALPWFWSDQYDLKMQTAGIFTGYDEEVVRGDPETGKFSVVYLKNGRVIAIDCVNAVKDFVQGRDLVMSGALIPAKQIADTSVSLKELSLA